MKLKLIENWRKWYKLWSIRLNAAGTLLLTYIMAVPDAIMGAWENLPAELKSIIPANYLMYITVALFILAMIARLIKQPKLENNA